MQRNTEGYTSNVQAGEVADVVILLGPDNAGKSNHQAEYADYIADLEQKGLKYVILGNGKDPVNRDDIQRLPAANHIVIVGHGHIRNENNNTTHRIDLTSQGADNTLEIIQAVQDQTKAIKVFVDACYGGRVNGDIRVRQDAVGSPKLASGTELVFTSPDDDTSLISQGEKAQALLFNAMKLGSIVSFSAYFRELMRVVPETITYGYQTELTYENCTLRRGEREATDMGCVRRWIEYNEKKFNDYIAGVNLQLPADAAIPLSSLPPMTEQEMSDYHKHALHLYLQHLDVALIEKFMVEDLKFRVMNPLIAVIEGYDNYLRRYGQENIKRVIEFIVVYNPIGMGRDLKENLDHLLKSGLAGMLLQIAETTKSPELARLFSVMVNESGKTYALFVKAKNDYLQDRDTSDHGQNISNLSAAITLLEKAIKIDTALCEVSADRKTTMNRVADMRDELKLLQDDMRKLKDFDIAKHDSAVEKYIEIRDSCPIIPATSSNVPLGYVLKIRKMIEFLATAIELNNELATLYPANPIYKERAAAMEFEQNMLKDIKNKPDKLNQYIQITQLIKANDHEKLLEIILHGDRSDTQYHEQMHMIYSQLTLFSMKLPLSSEMKTIIEHTKTIFSNEQIEKPLQEKNVEEAKVEAPKLTEVKDESPKNETSKDRENKLLSASQSSIFHRPKEQNLNPDEAVVAKSKTSKRNQGGARAAGKRLYSAINDSYKKLQEKVNKMKGGEHKEAATTNKSTSEQSATSQDKVADTSKPRSR